MDTFDLAYTIRPDSPSYSLENMAQHLELAHDRPHRALDDAIAAKMLFLNLLEDASDLDPMTLAAIQRLAQTSNWSLSYLLNGIAANPRTQSASPVLDAEADSNIGINGLDMQRISRSLHAGGVLREHENITPIDAEMVASLLGEGGALSHMPFPASRYAPSRCRWRRQSPKQSTMVSVSSSRRARASASPSHTCFPAALYALANGKRVVISTNTINLQEQLLKKDVPILVEALKSVEGESDDLRFTPLKGRANYLCMRRWNTMSTSNEQQTPDEARMLAKTMLWLQSTASGDRAEINLGHPRAAAPWERLSANNARGCLRNESVCFLRALHASAPPHRTSSSSTTHCCSPTPPSAVHSFRTTMC